MKPVHRLLTALTLAMVTPGFVSSADAATSAGAAERQNLIELRNTVVNLLQALVERGVLTREQAGEMVRQAQQQAAADAAAEQAREAEEVDAVRVPYVPEIVKEEIRKQVAEDLAKEVTRDVLAQAQDDGWGVPAGLPDWVQRVRFSGDWRVRAQSDIFGEDNANPADPRQTPYVDVLAVNERGGLGRAGTSAFLNTTENRERLRARLRLGLDAQLGYGWSAGLRLATGNFRDPVSTNQTLGNFGARYQVGVDLAYVKWVIETGTAAQSFTTWLGRMPSPWLSTDLVWDNDLGFEGIALAYRRSFSRTEPYARTVFATLGVFPIEEVELSQMDKWLFGGQVGADWRFGNGDRLRAGAAYYAYRNISGVGNQFESFLEDFTAPKFLQRGNTLFDIRNDLDPTTNLYALAARYELANLTLSYEKRLSERYRLSISADAVRNLGYDQQDVFVRSGIQQEPRVDGYQFELALGTSRPETAGAWRASVGYRYVERDAVLDAFTDSDFRLGGTDVQGFVVGAEYSLTDRILLRLRYLSGNEIDGIRLPELQLDPGRSVPANALGVDTVQLDLSARF